MLKAIRTQSASSVGLAFGFVGLMLVSAIAMAVLTVVTATTVDRQTLERQYRSAKREVAERVERLPKDQQSITTWDEAWARTYPAFETDWIDVNVGRYMHTYFQHDDVRIFAPDNAMVFASSGDQLVDLGAPNLFEPFRTAIARLRQQIAGKADLDGISISGLFDVEGRVAIASLAPIVPYTYQIPAGAQPYIHVTIKYLASDVSDLRSDLEFAGVTAVTHTSQPDDLADLPLAGIDGQTVGYLEWQPNRPGTDLMLRIAPAAALVAIILLIASVRMSQRMVQQSAELTAREAQARHLAFHDPLTGMANRSLLIEQIEKALAEHEVGKVAVHFLDLDRFKDINDTMGHAAGDAYLRQIAERILACLGPRDTAARLGGDEFVVLQCGIAGRDAAISLAAELTAAVRQPIKLGKDTVQLSTSLGIALSEPGISAAELLRRADICLYRAKGAGRNGFLLFSEEMDSHVQQKRALEVDLSSAMQTNGELSLVYQPLYGPDARGVEGAEALVRWNHPTKGPIPPQLFIQIAEECGLIIPLGEWILRQACTKAANWNIGYIAVNVSPVQFRQPNFAETVKSVLAETGLAAQRLELEITEGFLVDKTRSETALSALRSIGVKVALDDFGTGYSSLSYLRQFDVDKIKIDQSFVRQVADPSARSIIVAMVQLAKALNMRVTAEGVETEEQRRFLADVGCNQMQGYLLGRPQPPEEFEAKLRAVPQRVA